MARIVVMMNVLSPNSVVTVTRNAGKNIPQFVMITVSSGLLIIKY